MIIYGKNTVKEAILANRLVYIIYIDNKFSDRAVLNLIDEKKIKIKKVNKHELNLLTNNGLHQGIVADVKEYENYSLDYLFDGKIKNVLILDKIEDPHNLGAIIRTCEASGIDALIIGTRGQVKVTPTVSKIASGALEYLPIIEVKNLNNAIKELKDNNFLIIGAALEGEENFNLINKEYSKALIIGNEGVGISYLLKQNSDYLVKIPMKGKSNSLNASVAAGLLIYEMMDLFNKE